MRAAFSDLTVVDLTNSIAGNFCSKLLWAHGADVTIVEPQGGSPLRELGPAGAGHRADGAGPLFRHLNAGKKSVVLDPATADGATLRVALLDAADIVLCASSDPGWTDDAVRPAGTIECRVDEFDPAGPYADWRGSELIHQALSGVMHVTGRRDREPLYGTGYRAYYAAGVTAYITVAAAVVARGADGLGQRVGTTVAEASAAMGQNLVTQYGYNGSFPTRRRYPGMLSLLEASDGWVVLFALRSWAGLCETFDVPQLYDDPRFADTVSRSANWPEATAVLAETARRYTADELVDRGQARKVSMEKVSTLVDVANSPQLRARGMLLGEPGRTALGPIFRSRTGDGPRIETEAPPLRPSGAEVGT